MFGYDFVDAVLSVLMVLMGWCEWAGVCAGHHAGLYGPALPDSVRREAAKRLTRAVRGFTRTRQGSDPFALVLHCVAEQVK